MPGRLNIILLCLAGIVLAQGSVQFVRGQGPSEPARGQGPSELVRGSSSQADRRVPVAAPRPPVLDAEVIRHEPAKGLLAFKAGSQAGLAVGDRFWVVSDSEVRGWGTVFLVTAGESVGRLAGPIAGVTESDRVVVARADGWGAWRDRLPEGVTLRGRLERLPPGRHTAWLDLGQRVGMRVGDRLLVRRNNIPLARGVVTLLQDDCALAALQPVVGNALSEAGDSVELWPAPAERALGRVNSTVLDVQPDRLGRLITLVGAVEDGLMPGRLVDLCRDGGYVGVAEVVEVSDPLSVAQMIESASAQVPEVGDRAVMRSGSEPPLRPLLAAVFKVDSEDYCLVAAGEGDGIRVGEVLRVRRSSPEDPARLQDVAELTVQTVKVDHCGADVRMLSDTRLMVWDFAERVTPPWSRWLPLGVVRHIEEAGRWALADVDPRTPLSRGDVVRWEGTFAEGHSVGPERPYPGAAVVMQVMKDQILLFVPHGWGDTRQLARARVEVRVTPR